MSITIEQEWHYVGRKPCGCFDVSIADTDNPDRTAIADALHAWICAGLTVERVTVLWLRFKGQCRGGELCPRCPPPAWALHAGHSNAPE